MKKVIWVSDFSLLGSGYLNISVPLCTGLVERGHTIKALGLSYQGEEHHFPFTVLPATNIYEVSGMIHNLVSLWKPDVIVVALDIPLQEYFLKSANQYQIPFIGIFPIEADPLCMSWAAILLQMKQSFILSEFGVREAQKVGIQAQYLPVSLSSEWRPPTFTERQQLRTQAEIDDYFVVLTIADNQERKNLSRSMEIFADFSKDKQAVYWLVTKEHAAVGWKLKDYALELGISQKVVIFERGMPFSKLWSLLAMADAFLLTSKAEGACLPVLEAMSMGVPVLATNACALQDHLKHGRGIPLDFDYVYRDPFGNGRRYFVDRKKAVTQLNHLYAGNLPDLEQARQYAQANSLEESLDKLEQVI